MSSSQAYSIGLQNSGRQKEDGRIHKAVHEQAGK
jgi:hypothetical protein